MVTNFTRWKNKTNNFHHRARYYQQSREDLYTPASLPDLWCGGNSASSSCSQGCGRGCSIYNSWSNRDGHCRRNTVLFFFSTILSPQTIWGTITSQAATQKEKRKTAKQWKHFLAAENTWLQGWIFLKHKARYLFI